MGRAFHWMDGPATLAALDESREKVRRFRKEHDIPDAREIRAAKGEPRRLASEARWQGERPAKDGRAGGW